MKHQLRFGIIVGITLGLFFAPASLGADIAIHARQSCLHSTTAAYSYTSLTHTGIHWSFQFCDVPQVTGAFTYATADDIWVQVYDANSSGAYAYIEGWFCMIDQNAYYCGISDKTSGPNVGTDWLFLEPPTGISFDSWDQVQAWILLTPSSKIYVLQANEV